MSEAIILEFKGVTLDQYNAVNDILGIDGSGSGGGDWPAGLISHTAGLSGENFVVFEIWESQKAQEQFMQSLLGPAIGKVGLSEPSRVEWFSVIGRKAD
jgi:hypothetical protein